MGKRRSPGEGALYQRPDGLWAAAVELPPSADGKRRRKVITGKNPVLVRRKLEQLRRQLADHGDLPTAGQSTGAWLTYWVESIAAPRVRPSTLATYRSNVDRYLIPVLGKVPLDKLTPTHVRRLHQAITVDRGLSSTTALQAHRILARALKDAHREGRVTRNVATLTDAPRKAVSTRGALTVDQAVRLLASVADDPYGSRWATALFTGARQGECLGLTRDRVDFPGERLVLSWQLQRLPYAHGCGMKTRAGWLCGHVRGGNCPARVMRVPAGYEALQVHGGLHLTRPKSRSGWRVIPLVDPLRTILARHLEATTTELLWCGPDGHPIDPAKDWAAWHRALAAAELPRVPLHAARHTTATLLLAAGVPQRVITEILGHSSAAVSAAYEHVDLALAADAMNRLSKMLTA